LVHVHASHTCWVNMLVCYWTLISGTTGTRCKPSLVSSSTFTRRKIEDLPKGDGKIQGARVRVSIFGSQLRDYRNSGLAGESGRLLRRWMRRRKMTCGFISRAQRPRASSRQGARLPRVSRLSLLEWALDTLALYTDHFNMLTTTSDVDNRTLLGASSMSADLLTNGTLQCTQQHVAGYCSAREDAVRALLHWITQR
jgi:hypothetical protein